MRIIVMSVLVASLLTMSGSADAAPLSFWSSNGASCVPTEVGIQNNWYTVAGGAISANGGVSITVYCPVHNFRDTGNPQFLQMTHKGQTSLPPNASSITATLIAMDLNTGVETTIVTVTGASSLTVRKDSLNFTHTFNFDANYYYVKVVITSGITINSAKTLYGVQLLPCSVC